MFFFGSLAAYYWLDQSIREVGASAGLMQLNDVLKHLSSSSTRWQAQVGLIDDRLVGTGWDVQNSLEEHPCRKNTEWSTK